MKCNSLLIIVICSLFLTSTTTAKVASISFEDMVRDCHIIVIGRVKSVSFFKNATIEIIETLKGKPVIKLIVNVKKTWTCDISEANAGETILLFINQSEKTNRNQIYWSGRGRMPIDEVEGIKYATFWPEVRMPESVEIIKDPDQEYDFIHRANLDDLRENIQKILIKSPNNITNKDNKLKQ